MKVGLFKQILASATPDIDDSSVQFVFESDTATNFANVGPVMVHCTHFWNTVSGAMTHNVASYLHEALDRGSLACRIEVYDITAHLDGTPHGSPVAMTQFTLGSPFTTDNNEPAGCAGVVSFKSDYGTDVEFAPGARPRARDRNRFYVGPLNRHAISPGDSTHDATLSPDFIADVLGAFFTLSGTTSVAGEDWNLRQWSRRNAAVKLPTVAWMDPRVDYQRRRSDPQPANKTFKTLDSA